MKMNGMGWVVWVLLFVGGLNWGLVGFFDYDLVSTLFGEGSTLTKIVFDLVGLAAIWSLITMFTGKEGGSDSMGGQKPM